VKIKSIKLYRFEASEQEVQAMREMFQFFADNADEESSETSHILHEFGITRTPKQIDLDLDDERDETLPEKALRVSQGRRKSRLTGNE